MGQINQRGKQLRRPVFSPDGRTLAAVALGLQDDHIGFWNLKTRRKLRARRFPADSRTHIQYSPDGRWLAVARRTQLVLIDQRPTRKSPAEVRLALRCHTHSMAFSPDSRLLLTAAKGKVVRLWDVATGRLLHTFDFDVGEVTGVAFAPDGMTAAVGGTNGKVVIWDVDV
jgi:WD40 repeat protein